MRTILLIIALAAAAVGAGWYVQHLVGNVTLQAGATTIQAPLSLAVLALILLAVAFYLLFRLLATILRLPGAFRSGGARKARRRGDEAVTNTLIALAAQAPADARRESARAVRLLGETPQTLLLSAYAGAMSGNEAEAEAAFTKLSERKDAAFLGYRGLLRLAIEHEDYPRAAQLARDAERAHPGAAWLRGERTQLALRTGAWAEALQLTRNDTEKAVFGAGAAEAEADPAVAHKLAKAAWKRDVKLAPAAIAYARRLRAGNREKAALDVLRQSWTASPNPDIADFALAPAPDRTAALKLGRDLTKNTPEHPETHLLLARLHLAAGQPSEAATHIQAARSAGLDQKRLYLLQADIAEAQNDEAAQRDALRQAALAPPDPVWRCEACATAHAAWHPACPVCHTPGRIHWAVPSAEAPIVPQRIGYGPLLDGVET